MVMMKKLGKIEGIGSTSFCFFHPGEWVREKYPTDTRACMTGAIITGEGMQVVARRQQMCYLVTIPDIDGKCHIVKFNFRVHVNPSMSFESERQPLAPAEWPVVVAAWMS